MVLSVADANQLRPDSRSDTVRGMALKANQRTEKDVQALQRHAVVVERSCRVALEHAEFFPAEEAKKIRQELQNELKAFQQSVESFKARVPIKDIRASLAPEHDLRSWLIYRNMPATIARYSHGQVDSYDLRKREDIATQRLSDFQQRYKAALETVKELPLTTAERRDIECKLDEEKQTMTRGFALYRRGFSFVDIDRITGIGIQNRALQGAIPETTRYYGGDVLSTRAAEQRRQKCHEIRERAHSIKAEAQKKNEHEDPKRKASRFEKIGQELKSLDWVLRLYERGLSPYQIRRLTKLPAHSWILQGSLPPTLLRSSERLNRKDFKIPTSLDSDSSYIIGAYLARARSLNPRSLSFSAPSAERAVELAQKFERAFGLRPEPPRIVGTKHVLDIGRKEFVAGFKRLFNLEAGSVVPCFDSIIFYEYFRRPFLEGFLAFGGGHLDVTKERYSITRLMQREILEGVAVALYFEGILPTLHRAGPHGAVLQVCDEVQLRSLVHSFPQVGKPEACAELMGKPPVRSHPLDTIPVYERVMKVVRERFPKSKKINFKTIREEGGLILESLTFSSEERSRMKGWRAGHQPRPWQRAQALQRLARRMFPDRYNGV